MKLEKLIENAAEILGIDMTQGDANYNILFRCANIVLMSVASTQRDCVTRQTFTVQNGQIDFEKFNQTFFKVKSVKSGGSPVPYELYIDFLRVPNGTIEVEYACIPEFKSGDDDVSAIGGIMTENALLYGVLAEYAAVSTMPDEAKIWDAKFRALLFNATKTGKARVMPYASNF